MIYKYLNFRKIIPDIEIKIAVFVIFWIPAFAGMTSRFLQHHLNSPARHSRVFVNASSVGCVERTHKELTNKEKWTYLLKEGKEMDLNQLPQEIDIPEIRQAAQVMRRFSQRESDYLLYESRLDAQRQIATWRNSIERERQAKEQAYKELQQERREKERLISILKEKGIVV